MFLCVSSKFEWQFVGVLLIPACHSAMNGSIDAPVDNIAKLSLGSGPLRVQKITTDQSMTPCP